MLKQDALDIFAKVSFVLLVVLFLLWGISYIRPLQFSVRGSGGGEIAFRSIYGGVVIARLSWQSRPGSSAESGKVRNFVLAWPEREEPKGLPAELGFYVESKIFVAGHVFYGAGLTAATLLRFPYSLLMLITAFLPAVWGAREYRRWRARTGALSLPERVPTVWKWLLAHVIASYATLITASIGWWSVPPAAWWLSGALTSFFLLLVGVYYVFDGVAGSDPKEVLQGVCILLSYIVAFVLGLFWLGAVRAPNRARRRRRRGLCERCGYDMRATPERCPECGLVPGTRQHKLKA